MTIVARTSDYPPAERLDYWRTALCDAFVPLEPEPLDPNSTTLAGTLRHTALGGLQIADVRGSAQTVRRHPDLIRRGEPEWIKIGLQLDGCGVLDQDDRQAVLQPGDFAAYDTARPYLLAFATSFRMLVVMCPRSALRLPPADLARLTAVRISGRTGVGGLASPFLTKLVEIVQHPGLVTTDAVRHHLAESVLDVVRASLTDAGNDPAALARNSGPGNLVGQIQAYIESNLHLADLCLETIASAHHISVRYLQKLFERQGSTVSGWIRDRRLDNCRRDLVDDRLRGRPVSAIAARWGIHDAAYFSRTFHARYGVTPTAYRRSARQS
jgi:AraC-like DNA-binding protein